RMPTCARKRARRWNRRNSPSRSRRWGEKQNKPRRQRRGLFWLPLAASKNAGRKRRNDFLVAPTAVAAAPTATTAATVTRPLVAGTCLVDGERSAAVLSAVEGRDGLIAALGHLDETEAARTAGLAVRDDLRAGHGAVLAERLAEVVRRRVERQVTDIQIL